MTPGSRSNLRRAFGFAALLVLCVGCDHAVKQVAESALADRAPVHLLGDAVRLELAYNAGSFLSLGAGLPETLRSLFFVVLAPLALAFACIHVARSGRPSAASLVALALLAGGGLGNWIDRVMNGGVVVDFVSVGLGPLRTGIFNVADVCVMAGAALLILSARREPERGAR